MGPWIILNSYRYQIFQFTGQFCPPCNQPEAFVLRKDLFSASTYARIFVRTSQTFLKSSSCPEIHGHLHVKELSRKSWKKLYFILRRSGLYFSNKGTSKVRRNTWFYKKKDICVSKVRQTNR